MSYVRRTLTRVCQYDTYDTFSIFVGMSVCHITAVFEIVRINENYKPSEKRHTCHTVIRSLIGL